jgi:hypothetical protein
MGDYRAYILGIDGHRFVWVSDFKTDYRDDAAALDAAKGLSDKHNVEVWDGGRLVALLSPSGNELPPALAPSLPPDSKRIVVEPPDREKAAENEPPPALAPSLPQDSEKIVVETREPAAPSGISKLLSVLSLKR